MKARNLFILIVTSLLAFNGARSALAQGTPQAAPPAPPATSRQVIVSVPEIRVNVPAIQAQAAIEVPRIQAEVEALGQIDVNLANFIGTEFVFAGKTVKGAPYSAQAVTESVQVLGDGNRIVHKTTTQLYRDSEGRTRREQSVGAVGVWGGASSEAPQMIFINDPVAGVSYVLDSRTKTARKTALPAFNFPGTFNFQFGTGTGAQVFTMAGDGAGATALKALKLDYPPAAKSAGVQGKVVVRVRVNDAGAVESAEVVEGPELLRQASVDAAKQMRFRKNTSGTNERTIVFNYALSGQDSEHITINSDGNGVYTINNINRASGNTVGRTYSAAPTANNMAEIERRVATAPRPERESLGKQVIEGVEAEGTRTTKTIPAGSIGNEQPIKIINEQWYSPELQMTIMSKRSDPRFGETTYRITNLNRSDPAPSLFEPPPDYTVKNSGATIRRLNREKKVEPKP